MEILLASRHIPPSIGGIQSHLKDLAFGLIGLGHNVTLVGSSSNPVHRSGEATEPVEVEVTEHLDGFPFAFPSFRIWQVLRDSHPDVIHIHGAHNLFFLMTAFASSEHVPTVVSPHYHGLAHTPSWNVMLRLYKPILRRILLKADRILADSEEEAALLRSDFGIPTGRIALVPLGLNTDQLGSMGRRTPSEGSILYVGRVSEYKNVDKIIEALSILRYSTPSVTLTVVSPDQMTDIQRENLDRLGVSDRVRWLCGLSRRDLLQQYLQHEVFVMPSEQEAFSISTAEAIYLGLKVLVAETSGLREYVNRGLARGIPIPVDPRRLATRLRELLLNKEDRQPPRAAFSTLQQMTTAIEDVYFSVQR